MSDSLFTPDEVQEIKVDYQDGSWHVIDPEAENDVVCIFENEGLSSSHQKQKVTVRIIKFQQAVAGGNHYLTVQLLDEDEERNNQTGSKSSRGDSDRTYPERHLTQFVGSGEYVTLEAEVLWIDYIEKEKRNMPDVKGTLGEQGSTKKLPFIVTDNTSHPYFEEGKRFRFEGVKDHKYQKKNEVQALINEHTNIVELN